MTDSGQGVLHKLHSTQASSWKASIGLSALSVSAPVGQALTQDRHKVQPAAARTTAPNGAPCGSGRRSAGGGGWGRGRGGGRQRRGRVPPPRREEPPGGPPGRAGAVMAGGAGGARVAA